MTTPLLLVSAALLVAVGLAQPLVDEPEPDLDPATIEATVTHLDRLPYDECHRALDELNPIVVARCAARSARLASFCAAPVQTTLNAVLDPETSLRGLRLAILALSKLAPDAVRRALRSLPLVEAGAVYERLADDTDRVHKDSRDQLIARLVALPHQTVFISVVVDGVVRFAVDGQAVHRHRLPSTLAASGVWRQRAQQMRHGLRRCLRRLPPIVVDRVRHFTVVVQTRFEQRSFPDEVLGGVRAHFPPPFDDLFPFAALVADLVFDDLRPSGLLLDADIVADLAHLGLRFDTRRYLEVGLDPDNPVLVRILPWTRPARHLFERVGRPLASFSGLGHDPVQYLGDGPDAGQYGDARFLCDRRQYVLRLLATETFVAHLRRHPDQLYGAVAALIGRGHLELVDRVAQHPVLARVEFAALAQSLLLYVLRRRRPRVTDAAVLALLSGPGVDLFARTQFGVAPVVLLADDTERFEAILSEARFLRSVRLRPDHDLDALGQRAKALGLRLLRASADLQRRETRRPWLRDLMRCGGL